MTAWSGIFQRAEEGFFSLSLTSTLAERFDNPENEKILKIFQKSAQLVQNALFPLIDSIL